MEWIFLTMVFGILFGSIQAQDPVWAEWGQWGPCDKTCDVGIRTRYRGCVPWINLRCEEREGGFCTNPPCFQIGRSISNTRGRLEDDRAGSWEQWSSCSATCGGGSRSRGRRCRDGSCAETQGQSCNEFPCRGYPNAPFDPFEEDERWSPWGIWSSCSNSCGRGIQTRTRECQSFNSWNFEPCVGRADETKSCTEYQGCRFRPTLAPTWSIWSTWSTCSKSCGTGTRKRTRSCLRDSPCVESNTQDQECSTETCPPEWANWSQWSRCSATCGNGKERRTRLCKGGRGCRGDGEQERACSPVVKCPPTWTNWGPWSECSTTCGNGRRRRTRTCGSRVRSCFGRGFQSGTCNQMECKRDPAWNLWGEWSRCSKTCGGGIRSRNRSCDDGSKNCKGIDEDSEKCRTNACRTSI